MNFFKEIDGIIGTNTVTISVTKDNARLIVLVVPRGKDGEPTPDFVPMTISGTPEQLDAGFMMSLSKSLDLLSGIKANLDEIEKAAAKTKEKAAKTKPGKSSDKKTKEEATLPMADEPDINEPEGDDDIPWEDTSVDKQTGEIKTPEPAKAGSQSESEPGKPAKPAAVKPAAAKKPEPVQATMTPEPEPTPEPPKPTEDEW
jgi:PRTRC genetic system protein E